MWRPRERTRTRRRKRRSCSSSRGGPGRSRRIEPVLRDTRRARRGRPSGARPSGARPSRAHRFEVRPSWARLCAEASAGSAGTSLGGAAWRGCRRTAEEQQRGDGGPPSGAQPRSARGSAAVATTIRCDHGFPRGTPEQDARPTGEFASDRGCCRSVRPCLGARRCAGARRARSRTGDALRACSNCAASSLLNPSSASAPPPLRFRLRPRRSA